VIRRRAETSSRAFVAIDFETANGSRESACAVAAVRVEDGVVSEKRRWLIRPPTREFSFTWLHGIAWSDVRAEPRFGAVWPEVMRLARGVEFLAAHNASFDRSVLAACARSARIRLPATRFECSMLLARRNLGIYPTTLPDVCRRLRIPLRHHDPLSDAEACARIVIAAMGRPAAARS